MYRYYICTGTKFKFSRQIPVHVPPVVPLASRILLLLNLVYVHPLLPVPKKARQVQYQSRVSERTESHEASSRPARLTPECLVLARRTPEVVWHQPLRFVLWSRAVQRPTISAMRMTIRMKNAARDTDLAAALEQYFAKAGRSDAGLAELQPALKALSEQVRSLHFNVCAHVCSQHEADTRRWFVCFPAQELAGEEIAGRQYQGLRCRPPLPHQRQGRTGCCSSFVLKIYQDISKNLTCVSHH